nr:hypothetical protein [Tanacetum cinerariifolium]
MSRSLSVSRNKPELMLNQLELGATGTIVVMICGTWDVNSSTGRYLSTDFIVSDKEGYLMHYTARGNIAHNFLLLKEGPVYSVSHFLVQPNKEDFRVMRFADFMLECNGDTRVRKSSVKSEGFNRYPFQFVEIDDLEPTNKKYLIDRLYLSNTYSSLVIDDEKIPVLKRLEHDDSSGLELTKEVLPGDDTLLKPRTLENLLMWARNRKYDSATFHCDVKIDKIRTKNDWNFPSCGGEKCKKGNIGRKGGQFWCDSCDSAVDYPVLRYMLEIEISDDTAEVVVVLFDETATSLLKCFANAMVASQAHVCVCTPFNLSDSYTDSQLQDEDENTVLPATLANIVGTSQTLELKSHAEKLEDSDVEESFVADSQPKGDVVGCSSDTKKKRRRRTQNDQFTFDKLGQQKWENRGSAPQTSFMSLGTSAALSKRGMHAKRKEIADTLDQPLSQTAPRTTGTEVSYHSLGAPSYQCHNCNATMWYEERNNKGKTIANLTFSRCCQEGKVLLPRFIETPKPLRRLLDYTEPATSRFRDQIRVYNEVAAFITNDFGDGDPTRDIIVNTKDGQPKRISELHTSYMALQYPLLFPYGEDGHHDKIPYHRNTRTRKTNRVYVTMKEYYAYVIQYMQNQGTALHIGRRLFQQYLNTKEIDDIISVKLPLPTDDPMGYKAATDYMLHDPYGKDARRKMFQTFSKTNLRGTIIDQNGYPIYRRRDNKVTFKKGTFTFDDRYVVPHNRYMLLKYQAHINVEWCNRSKAIKYLFKYLNKRMDRETIVIQENVPNGQADTTEKVTVVDEIKNYLNCRYLAPCEAVWRMLSFDIQYSYPSMMKLNFHLPYQQPITLRGSDNLPALLERECVNVTTFTDWFALNERYPPARARTYVEIS